MVDFTLFLKTYAKFRKNQLKRKDYAAIQTAQLQKLVRRAVATRFGRQHGFDRIRNAADYQRQVPLRTYEQFWQDYWQPAFPRLVDCTWPGLIPYFPVSSGTSSGTTKYIPYTLDMYRSNTKASLDLLVHHLSCKNSSRIFGGKSFMLGGSTNLVEQCPGVYSGDLSGISVKTMPWWARMRYFPPADLALLSNWEEKIEILTRRSLREDIRMISGVPSWMIIFFDKVFELTKNSNRSISEVFPELEMLVHGGVNFAPYYERFAKLLSGSTIDLREVYPASEGFIAVADRGYKEGLRLVLDHGIFFEFVPVDELAKANPTRHWAADLETGVNYALVMTTCAGLWSYVIGDTVKFIDRDPPRLLVTGRTTYTLSAFGEHLISEEIEDAVSTAAQAISKAVTDYSVGALFPDENNKLGGHRYVIEFAEGGLSLQEQALFIQTLDKRLRKRNEDYDAHRAEGYGLRAPELLLSARGGFAAWMKKRGKLGGQNKVPRIIIDQSLFEDLTKFILDFKGR